MKMEITKIKPIISDIPDATRGHLTRRTIPMRTAGRSPDGLIYILSGSCHYTFDDGTSFGVKENDILYLAAGAKYQMDISCDKYEYYVVNFTLFGNEERQSAVYTPRSAASAEQLFARLAGHRGGSAPLSFTEMAADLYRLLALLMECSETNYIGSKTRAVVEEAANTIHRLAADPTLSAARLAREASLSEVYFRKLFRRRFGVSPAHYIMQARITLAKQLMRMDGLRLEEIAEQSGFSSLPYFCKVFKSITGYTPAAFRKELL